MNAQYSDECLYTSQCLESLVVVHTTKKSLFALCAIFTQTRHRDEIEQIRKAGHDSLAMIVEQYKVIHLFIVYICTYIYLLLTSWCIIILWKQI